MDYPPDTGMLLTRYAPLRRSPPSIATRAAPRLACVKPAASVHPEPGSNSSSYIICQAKLDYLLCDSNSIGVFKSIYSITLILVSRLLA